MALKTVKMTALSEGSYVPRTGIDHFVVALAVAAAV